MNRLFLLSVSVVLALIAFGGEEAKAQTDVQFLNTRKTLPTTIGDVEFTDVTTYCQSGCQRNYATSLLGITGWTPRLVWQNVSIGQLEQSVKPQMLKDYCNSPAKQRNIGAAVYVYDMYKTYIGVFSIAPKDCAAASVSPKVTSSSVEDQYWDAVKNSSRVSDFQDYLNNYPNGQYVPVARLRISQLTAATPGNTVTSPPRQQTVAEILASAQYGSISEILPLRKVFVVATDLDSRDTILKELQSLQKLIVVGRKEDADFYIIFALTDQATGANIAGNANPVDQTYLGEMLVCSARAGTNGEIIPRILWRTKKTQVFSSGITFNRHPAVNAAREFVKELKKINF